MKIAYNNHIGKDLDDDIDIHMKADEKQAAEAIKDVTGIDITSEGNYFSDWHRHGPFSHGWSYLMMGGALSWL